MRNIRDHHLLDSQQHLLQPTGNKAAKFGQLFHARLSTKLI